jgi:hypothetical protein
MTQESHPVDKRVTGVQWQERNEQCIVPILPKVRTRSGNVVTQTTQSERQYQRLTKLFHFRARDNKHCQSDVSQCWGIAAGL